MSHTTNDTEDTVVSKDQTESALTDEGNCVGSANGGVALKKGPWTSTEDAILIDYVQKHGEGNWNAVQKCSGLSRCGKSCRLRWANHLRPNLKKGAFTQEEEQLIIELHAKMGNKWARMAAHLPGRTDNEIKNYWNTRIKRHQRAGLPLYPPEFSLQAMHEIQKASKICGGDDDGDESYHDILQTNGSDIPDVMFDSLKANQGILPYVPQLPDITANNMLMKGLESSQYDSFMSPTVHCRKRLRESMTCLPGFSSSVKNEFSLFYEFPDGTCDKVSQSFGLSFPFEPDPTTDSPSFEENQDSHTISSGDFSASKPTAKAMKYELPSLQHPETGFGSWGTSSPPQPLLESIDTFIQSPSSGTVQSNCPSPHNSGLLDALLHEAKTLSGRDHSSDKGSNSSSFIPGYNADSSTLNICKTEWEDYGPLSPLGHTSTLLFSERTPVSASGTFMDERPSTETITGCLVKSKIVDDVLIPDKAKETSSQLDIIRPDALFASEWFEQSSAYVKDQFIMTDAVATLLGDDLSSDYKQMAAGASMSNQVWGFGSCSWNNMPAVCQMSELP